MTIDNIKNPKFFELNELCSVRNGGKIVFATDDWFAVAENMLTEDEPISIPDKYTDYGKWMDGWVTRRKRIAGHDWCIVKLGVPGFIHGVDVDTAFFTGNYTPRFSLQGSIINEKEEKLLPTRISSIGTACTAEDLKKINELNSESWTELIPMTNLNPGYPDTRHNYHVVKTLQNWTHIRFNMFPDGGIARLRVFGEAHPDWSAIEEKNFDLIAMKNGGVCKGYSNAHFGHPRNLIKDGKGVSMGDGWETARRLDRPPICHVCEKGIVQVPGSEWAVFEMGHVGIITKIKIDTTFFKGNYPESIKIEGALKHSLTEWDNKGILPSEWKVLLPPKKLHPNHVHIYTKEDIDMCGPYSYVRITIAPDGGISRIRLYGDSLQH